MLTAKDAKNSQNASYVIAGTVVINFMILVLVLGPEATGFDPTWWPVSSLLNFFNAWFTLFFLGSIGVVFKVRKSGELYILNRIVWTLTVINLAYTLTALFQANSVFETLLDADIISEISGLPTNALFLVFGIWALRLIALDQQNLIQGWVKVAGQGFGYLVIVAQVGSMFGLIPAVAFGPLFILGGVVLFPAFIIGLGQIIGSSTTEG